MTMTIADAAKISGISAHTLRFYDKQGLLPHIQRNEAGFRIFTEQDIEFLQFINCMKNTGMKIKDIRQYIQWCMQGNSTLDLRLEFLHQHKKNVEYQRNMLDKYMQTIDKKLEFYAKETNSGKYCEIPLSNFK